MGRGGVAASLLSRAARVAALLALGGLAGCGNSPAPSAASTPEAEASADAPLSIVAVPLVLGLFTWLGWLGVAGGNPAEGGAELLAALAKRWQGLDLL